MNDLLEQIAAKKAELDRLRVQSLHALGNLEHVHDLELTYTNGPIQSLLLPTGVW
jgi:ribosomal protein L29